MVLYTDAQQPCSAGAERLLSRNSELVRRTGKWVCLSCNTCDICAVPNQRSKTKVRLGGFIGRELYRAVLAQAKLEGMERDKFGFAQKLLLEALQRREKRAKARFRAPRRR